MRIIVSPAKQMRIDNDFLLPESEPLLLSRSEMLLEKLRSMSYEELKNVWGCNDKIASDAFEYVRNMTLHGILTPAVLAYDGIAFKYMAPNVFENDEFEYVKEHLRILSGFYGVLRPMDGVDRHRLEMQAKLKVGGKRDLYEFWGDSLYKAITEESRVIVNLASKEYSRCIEKHLTHDDTFVTCVFGELEGGKVVQKGVYCKMARGEAVRFMAEKKISAPQQLKAFDRLGYAFDEKRSDEREYVFLK